MRPLPLLASLSFICPLAAQFPPQQFADIPVVQTAFTEELDLLADLDGDGDLDAIAFAPGRSSFRPMRNGGSGIFEPGASTPITTSGLNGHVAVGDVDGDTFADLLLSTSHAASASVADGFYLFRGQPAATFAPAVHVPLSFAPQGLSIGNANGDACRDILLTTGAPGPTVNAQWLLGDVALAFAAGPSVSIPASYYRSWAVARDFDGDGKTDVALVTEPIAAPSTTLVSAFLTTSSGLTPAGSVPLPWSFANGLVGCDLEGDGDGDLLVWRAHLTTTQFVSIEYDNGTIAQSASQSLNFTSDRLRVADLDNDGDADLMARKNETAALVKMSWARNDLGVFTHTRSSFVPGPTTNFGAGFGDLDGNGRVEYVDARFVIHDASPQGAVGPVTVGAIDWDGDGDLDVQQDLTLKKNDGRGVLTTVPTFWPPSPGPNLLYLAAVATADFDGDSRPELLVPFIQSNGIGHIPATFLEMRLLEADGDDALHDVGAATAPGVRIPAGGLVVDADSDGDPDYVTSEGVWQYVSGSFTLVPQAFQGHVPIAKGDVDGDGDEDLVAVQPGVVSVALLHRVGPASYTFTTLIAPAGAISGYANTAMLADLDDDGDLDVAAIENGGANALQTRLFTNTAGTFASALVLPFTGSLMSGDLDEDGMTDLILHEYLQTRLLRRVGPGLTYAPALSICPWFTPTTLADFDQDGDLDFVGARAVWNDLRSTPVSGQHRQYGVGSVGTGGHRPLLSMVGAVNVGETPTIRLVSGFGGSLAVLMAGTFEVNVPDVLPGIAGYIGDLPIVFSVPLGGVPGQPGDGSFELPLTLTAADLGLRLFMEALVLDPAGPIGLTNSNGCEFVVGQ